MEYDLDLPPEKPDDPDMPLAPLPPLMHDKRLPGARVAVLGLGIEGRDLASFLAARGAQVTVFDSRPRAAVAAAADELEALGCTVQTETVPEPKLAKRFVALYVSQSVLLHRDPFVQACIARNRPVSSMLREFLRRWPGRTVGITGSSGKTTTTSLVAATFAAARVPHIVGGNIGGPLLEQLEGHNRASWAVLEISHTQLQLFDSPLNVGAVTNVTRNHLDQFSWDGYLELKRRLVRALPAGGVPVLNAGDPISRTFTNDTKLPIAWFARERRPNLPVPTYWIEGRTVIERGWDGLAPIVDVEEIPLRGAHNVENVLAAVATARAAGLPLDACERAVRGFTPVPHRLEHVATVAGVAWFNDSIATSPERTLAAIRSFDRGERLVLLLGGREKHLPLDELIALAAERCRAVILFGEAADVFGATFAADPAARALPLVQAGTLQRAVDEAARRAGPGDVVLLAPAGTSFDAYPNFERRGEEFRALVQQRQRGPSQPSMAAYRQEDR